MIFMDKNAWWAWTIKNSVSVICWVALAVIFNKWWIALFGLLFMSDFKMKHKNYRICDKCGKHSPYEDSYDKAIKRAEAVGWIHYDDGNRDYCPDCQLKIYRHNLDGSV